MSTNDDRNTYTGNSQYTDRRRVNISEKNKYEKMNSVPDQ
jgi:hypothetical protein